MVAENFVSLTVLCSIVLFEEKKINFGARPCRHVFFLPPGHLFVAIMPEL